MPIERLATIAIWRWLAAGALLVGAGLIIAVHAWQAGARRDTLIDTVVGDAEAVRRRMEVTSDGLGIRLDAQQRALLYNELTANPMNGSAVALAALDHATRGEGRRAVALSRQAIRVEPRTRLAWLALLHRQMRQGNNLAATTSALRLLAVDSRQYGSYMPILATLARDGRTTAAIAGVLQQGPIWRTRFIERLAYDRVDPAIRYALLNPSDHTAVGGAVGDDAGFVGDLVNRGDVERAYLAWVSLLPDAALMRSGMPYDGGFDGLPGPAPFNWRVTAANPDHATLGAGVLEISYSGRQTAVLASQIVLPEANGRYRIDSLVARADQSTRDGAALVWQLSCLPGRAPLTQLALDRSSRVVQRGGTFVVPGQGCEAAVLALVGLPDEMPVRLTAKIDSVALRRVGTALASRRGCLPGAAGDWPKLRHPCEGRGQLLFQQMVIREETAMGSCLRSGDGGVCDDRRAWRG